MTRTKYPIFKCLRRGQKGFTLIELLIVVAILGIVAGVVIPNATAYFGRGKAEAILTETDTVQTAMFAIMSDAEASNVTAQSSATNNLTGKPGGTGDHTFDDYLSKDGVTKYYYTWTDDGDVTCANTT